MNKKLLLPLILTCMLKVSVLHAQKPGIRVIELRNYLLKPEQRDVFIQYFEDNFIASQNQLGAWILGQYRVKGTADNFMWFRGFNDMASRKKYLNDFYYGPFWKSHRNVPNGLLLNNDNVHLLEPLALSDSAEQDHLTFDQNWFAKKKGLTVVDFYISNTKLPGLISFVRDKYKAVLENAGVTATSFWIAEPEPNDFPGLPVFQDKNLLVQITFYENEEDYQVKSKKIITSMTDQQKADMADLVTLRNTLLLYPTKRSFTHSQ